MRFDDRVTGDVNRYAKQAKIIHFEIDPAEVNKNIEVDVAVLGDAKQTLNEILKITENKSHKKWHEKFKELYEIEYKKVIHDDLNPKKEGLTMGEVMKEINIQTKGDAAIVSDVGQHQMFAAQYYHFDEPRKWINSGGLGTMGFGLPAALGVKLAFRDSEVVCITGEGSIQMCIQELSTCTQYNLPIKIININNEALGMVKQWQDMNYSGRHSESTYQSSLPNFVELVESYGHVGIKIEKNSDLKKGLEEAFAIKDKLVFVDVYVDPDEHVYPMLVAPNGSLKDMWLSKDNKV